jgi:hypothetical protein
LTFRHHLIKIRLRGILLGHERLGAGRIELREIEGRARIGQLTFGLIYVRLKNNGIDLGDYLSRFHDRIKIGEELLDIPRDLASDLDILDRIQGSRRGDGLGERPAGYGDRLEMLSGAAATLPKSEPDKDERDNDGNDWKGSFKHFGSLTMMIALEPNTTARTR